MNKKLFRKWTMFFIAMLWTTTVLQAKAHTEHNIAVTDGIHAITKTALSQNESKSNAIISVNPESYDFIDYVDAMADDLATFTISNEGSDDLIISNMSLSGESFDDFDIMNEETMPITIAAGESYAFEVEFIATLDGNYSAGLIIENNSNNAPQLSIPLSGDYNDSSNNIDNDGDGYIAIDDCDDYDPSIHPGAYDIPNDDIDQDCDGEDATSSANMDRYITLDVTNGSMINLLFFAEAANTPVKIVSGDKTYETSCGIHPEGLLPLDQLEAGGNTMTIYGDITEIICDVSNITAVNSSHNTILKLLDCFGNQISTLDLSQNTALTTLYCNSNQLLSLDVSQNTALTQIFCDNNSFTTQAINDLYCSLPDRQGLPQATIYILEGEYDDNSDIVLASNKQIAIDKNWAVQYRTTETDIPNTDGTYVCGNTTVSVTGISLDIPTATLTVGNTQELIATITPDDATNQNVTWSSSDTNIATVIDNSKGTAKGLVTGITPGTATITVTTEEGNFSATCLVTVKAPSTDRPFITKWNTEELASDIEISGSTVSSTNTQIYFPGIGTNYTIEWEEVGDATHTGTKTVATSDNDNPVLIEFDAPGEYIVKVYPQGFERIQFADYPNPYGDQEKLTEIQQWGDVQWTSMVSAFDGCKNMQLIANDTPNLNNVTNMAWMFSGCIAFNQDISGWNVSNVTNMNGMFYFCSAFNQDLSSWNVSNVTNMRDMFEGCAAFNQDLSSWNVSKVTDMDDMFNYSGMNCANYDNTLIGWANNPDTPNDLVLGASFVNYSPAAQAAHDKLINEKHWTIYDAGVDEDCGGAVSVTGVSVNPTTAILATGNTQQLTATVEPTNASNKNVTWSTSDSNIATVDANGLVTGIAPGTATITVTTEEGNFSATCLITVEESLAPANDLCANAIALNCGDVVTGTNIGATGFDATADDACGVSDNAVGVWYTFEGNGQFVTFSTCNEGTDFDTKIAVFTGTCSDLTCVDYNDDGDDDCDTDIGTSILNMVSEVGKMYYIYVSGYDGETGNFELSVTCEDVPVIPNDLCANAIELNCGDEITGTNIGATGFDATTDEACGVDDDAVGVWYTFEGNGQLVTFSTCSVATDFDTEITVFKGSCDDLTCVGNNDEGCDLNNASTFTFISEEDIVYYAYVSGWSNETGNFELSITCEENTTTPDAPTITVENMCGYSVLTASNYSGTLTWSTGENTESITVTTAGVYSVTQTINGMVSAPATETANPKVIPDAPIVTVDNQVGQSVLTASNYSGTLTWSNGETTESITVTTAGTYSVTQTIDGCESLEGSGVAEPTTSSTITPNAPTITVSNECGYSVLTASNYSGTLSWSTGESTESITVTMDGVYSVMQNVSGINSDAATITVTIKPIPDAPIVMVDNQAGQSVLTAGNYSGDLLWSNGETSESITVNTAGIYSVTQTIDGCESPEGSGEAAPLYPLFDIDLMSYDFGEVEVSQDATQMFTITNNGTATLVITMFEINGSADFTHNGMDNTEVAPNGGTYTFSATFAPQVEGEQTATITITDNITRETHDVILTGNGKISPCDYWIGNCDICGCFDTTTGEPFELNVSVGTNGSVYCPEDNSGTWSVVAMPAGLTATPTFTDIHNYNTTFYAPIPGDYILRYTWGALYNNQYLEARYRIVEKPIISIHGDEVVNICKTNEYTVSDDREYNTETLTYSWSIEGGTISGSTTGESVVVQWDNQAGTATLTASAWYSDYDVCSRTVEFTVEKKNPTFAGQVKYWNQEETYIPSPYQTCDYCTNPHDYFYVTLLHNENRGFIELDTQKVQPRLTEDLMELMSYFEFDIDVAQYGCDAEFALRIWDGGLVYHDNLPAGQPTNTHLGANYTYKHFGSVNATDALAIQLMVGGANNINAAPYNYNWVGLNTDTPQYGFYSHSIADVNSSNPYANGGITALDALTVKYRSVGLIANYPDNGSDNEFSPNYRVAGRMVPELPYTTFPEPFDWDNEDDIDFRHSGAEYEYMSPATAHYYESQPFAWNSRDYSFINIYYNLVGDINSSYTPEGNISKRDSDVELAYEEAVSAQVGEEVTLPIRINHTEKLGAITLSMTYRNDLIEVLSTNYDKANGEYHIDAENGLLNIAWYDSYGKTFANDEAIAYITVKVLQPISENTELFSLTSTTEFADVNAHKLEGIKLSTYNLNNSAMPESSTFSSMNYPNPFKQHTTIAYTLPESGEVNIAVYDLTGRLVKHLISEVQTAGTHTIEYSAPIGLNSGLLIYKITLNGNDGVKTITKKMSVSLVSNR